MSQKSDLALNRLKQNIERGMQEIQQSQSHIAQRLMCLPDGHHVVRLFADPNGKYYFHSPYYHKIGRVKALCRGRKCEICKLATATGNWKLKKKRMVIFYMEVVRTSNPDRNWRAGAVGPVLVKQRLGHSLTKYIDDLDRSDSAVVSGWFNPSQNARLFDINDGRTWVPENSGGPVHLGDWHKPFDKVWPIPDTDESYFTVLAEARVECGDVGNTPSDDST